MLRAFSENWRTELERMRRQNQLDAFNSSGPNDLYVTMTIQCTKELERLTMSGWDLVIQIPPIQASALKDLMPPEYLVRIRKEDLRVKLGL